MKLEGGCYCGQVRYVAEGKPAARGECHCRECQYIAGGAPNYFMLMPPDGFRYVAGEPKRFKRDDLPNPVTREFCANCGTHLVTLAPGLPQVVLKVGSLDDPGAAFGDKAQVAVNMLDAQPFHMVAEGVAKFDRMPPAR